MKKLLTVVQENKELDKYITLVEASTIDPYSAAEEILRSGVLSIKSVDEINNKI